MSKIRLYGSSSGYIDIAPAAAASNNTLTAPSTVGEIIAKDAAGAIGITSMKASNVNVGAAVTITESGIEASGIGITVANINGAQIGGRRNIIINGAMEVAQRGAAATTDQLYQTVDRMRLGRSGVDGNPSQEQLTLGTGTDVYALGFRKSYKIINGNQTSGAGVTDSISVSYRVEARDIRTSGWDYVNPNSFITLSFWSYSTVGQTYYLRLRSMDGTSQNYTMSYTLPANTWTKVVKTIPGNSNIQFDDDVNQGLQINWFLYSGTDYTSSSMTLNSWAAYDSTNQSPDQTTTWYTTNDATWNITGLQLEVGSQATPFEHRNFGDELALCQRYYCKSYDYDTVPGTNTVVGTRWGRNYSDANRSANPTGNCTFPVTMRTLPTLSVYSKTGTLGSWTKGGTSPSSASTDEAVSGYYSTLSENGFFALQGINPSAANWYGGHFTAEAEI